jgi:hypothetical protein
VATSRLIGALCAVVGIAFALAGPATASCGLSGYSYAGIRAASSADGISARLAAVSAPKVENGHVAAWVGVGGSGAGAGGADEWLQVGLSAEPGASSRLYYEVAQPGYAPRYVVLDGNVPVGSTHSLAVLEVRGRRDVWRVWVDGSPASQPLYLPGSHHTWNPIATAESWDGGVASCNGFGYKFSNVSIATRPGGGWQRLVSGTWLQDPGYRVQRRSPSVFLAGRA